MSLRSRSVTWIRHRRSKRAFAAAEELDQFCDRIPSCWVVVERRHRHHEQANYSQSASI